MNKTKEEEKAEELIQIFIPIIDPDFGKIIRKDVLKKATQCAILHVEKIIEALLVANMKDRDFYNRVLSILQNKG
jgi:hypothetical protein